MAEIADASVQCCVTSPPYFGLRDYGHTGQIGLEQAPEEYVSQIVAVMREVRRVLRDDGTLWLNLGDSYAANRAYQVPQTRGAAAHDFGKSNAARVPPGLKPKDLIGIPWRVAFALQADGWWLRQDNIWHKPNPMPESVTDRCTKAHEYVFLLSKSARYYYDAGAVAEPVAHPTMLHQSTSKSAAQEAAHFGNAPTNLGRCGTSESGLRNRRSVWTVATEPYSEAHFAVMPRALVEPCIKAGSRPGDLVLDPFAGAGTVAVVALALGRRFIGCELNPEYAEMAQRRITDAAPLFNVAEVMA